MRKTLLLSALFGAFSLNCFAKIWRVNNINGVAADFTTIQAAHDGAASGDTIHVEGSPNAYGALTSVKKLVILGPGYFLDQNADLQAVLQTAKLTGITYRVGSSGSQVMGIDFQRYSIAVYCNDIIIQRNKFCEQSGQSVQDYFVGSIYLYYLSTNGSIPVSDIIISQNYGVNIEVGHASTGILITNNYITEGANYTDATQRHCLSAHENAVLLIQHNIFRRGKVTTYNSNVSNNIMHTGVFEGTGNLSANNIGSGTQFGTSNGNKSNIDMATVFIATGSADNYWKLKPGSPAIGAGYGHTSQDPVDCGMFSGYSPYVLSGIPPIPSIYFFDNQPIGSANDPINVTVKVRSNN